MQLGNPPVASNEQPAPNQRPYAAQHRAWSTYLTLGTIDASFSQNALVRRTPSNFGLLYLLESIWNGVISRDLRGFAAITDEPPVDVAAAGRLPYRQS